MSAPPTQPVIYVAQPNGVVILSQRRHHEKLGVITDGVRSPYGLWVDAAATLYVANHHGHSVTIYPAGDVHPALTLSAGLTRPLSVAVDAAGTVYVGDFSGEIVEYPAGQTTPSLIIPAIQVSPRVAFPFAETIDSNGNLFVGYSETPAQVVEYAPGSITPEFPGIQASSIEALAFDRSRHLLLGVPDTQSGSFGIFIYKLNPVKELRRFGPYISVLGLAFDATGDRLYVVDPGASNHIDIFSYPRGEGLGSINVGSPAGIALSPRLPL